MNKLLQCSIPVFALYFYFTGYANGGPVEKNGNETVSVANSLYVSVAGNDKNAGTKEKPLASIQMAQKLVRATKGPATVFIRGGVYYLKTPVVFNPQDARLKGEEVNYTAYPGENVIISSAVPLQLQWKTFKGNIKQAYVAENIIFDQLFLNGQQQRMARFPNYDPNINHFGGYADVLSAETANKWKSPAGAYIHSLHENEWGDFSYEITGKDSKGELIMMGGFQNNRPSAMHKKFRFIENVFEELDTEGEWYFDKREHMLYFYPPKGTDLGSATIETPQLESLFQFAGTGQKPVTNIGISGLQLTQTVRTFMKNKEPLLRSDWTICRVGTVTMEGAENCWVKDCYFNSVGGNAIVFTNYNRHNELSGCRIIKAGSSAVVFVGDPQAVRSPLFRYEQFNELEKIDRTPGPQSGNYPAQCLVYNNLIEEIGQTEKQVAGVQISMSKDITVSHNTIDLVPRSGININEGTWGGHIIEYNDVFNTVLETGDHGSFNSWGRDRFWHPDRRKMDSLALANPELILLDAIEPNIIRNNRFCCDHGWDIDLDDGSSNYEIYNNVLLNGGLKLREGFYRKVYNNIMVNNSFHPHVWFKNSGDVFKHNIISAPYFPIYVNYWGKEIDYNLFPDSSSCNKARKQGTDAHSAYGDPMFTDALSGNYKVKDNSPALRIGFKNFAMDSFGVVSPALKSAAHKVSLPVIASALKPDSEGIYDFMGAKVKNMSTLGERSATGMSSETGVLVLEVPKASILYGVVYPNDVILGFDNHTVTDMKTLMKAKMGLQLSHTAVVEVFRNQQRKKVEIDLK